MDEIIKINYKAESPTVSARDLYDSLKIEKRFSAWFDTNSTNFVNGEDYTPYLQVHPQNKQELQDYYLTIDMAKHIALMSRTHQGKVIRQHFIDLEKIWNTPEQVFARALKMADVTIDKLKGDNKLLIEDIERMKPKARFADAVATSYTSILIGELAKLLKQNGIEIGPVRLFDWLRENGYLIKRRGTDWNTPTQRSMELGVMEIKESTINTPDGQVRISKTPKITGKGQQYFIDKFLRQ